MEMSKCKLSDDKKEAWITLRQTNEGFNYITVHIISNDKISVEKLDAHLNIKPED